MTQFFFCFRRQCLCLWLLMIMFVSLPAVLQSAEPDTCSIDDEQCQEESDQQTCVDQEADCQFWADIGECAKKPQYMLSHCPIACDSCDDIAYNGDSIGCPLKFPNCQSCEDDLDHCESWLQSGECETHPGYMVLHCAHSCKYCHLRSDYNLRCPVNEEYRAATRALHAPGDLNRMFENILKYKEENADMLDWTVEALSRDPWVLRFDNMFNEAEAKRILEVSPKFERSTDVGKKDSTGHFGKITSTARTSLNAWCQAKCWADPTVQMVMARAEHLMNISLLNTETLQILEYSPNQYYRTHHDFISDHLKMSCGPRILTWFMYLSDVEEGGETAFPTLGIVNAPKLGRVILWPSVLDSDPWKKDGRTMHEARPVTKGVKYAANAWVHLYDFQTPNLWSCTG